MYIFDLDGTLVDTRAAVKEAYRRVGVTMPDDAWGVPWTAWLKSKSLHENKAKAYPRCLKEFASKLPLFDFAQKHQAPIITGASTLAVQAIEKEFGQLNIIKTYASRQEKIKWIINICDGTFKVPTGAGNRVEGVIYVDDDEVVIARLQSLILKKELICQAKLPYQISLQALYPPPEQTQD